MTTITTLDELQALYGESATPCSVESERPINQGFSLS